MTHILIDPVIATVPSDDTDREEVERWLESLNLWLKEALTAPFTWHHYSQASELLEMNNQFPSFQRLKQLQQNFHLDINIPQIARYVNDFFRDDTFDFHARLTELEFLIELETDSIAIEPEQFMERLPAYVYDDFCLLLAHCCTCKQVAFPIGQKLHIATRALETVAKMITVSTVVLDAVPDFDRSPDNKIIQTFPLMITPDDLQPLIDVVDIWEKGEQAIRYAIEQQCRHGHASNSYSHSFDLGPSFIESVNRRGLATNDIFLHSFIRAAADIIADKAKEKASYRLHPFRQSETADSPQLVRERDNGKAWRLMLQKHGAGWRLHYWHIRTQDGDMIEFANVCKESERDIY